MKRVKGIRIASLVLCFILMASINTVHLIVKAAGVKPEIIWLNKDYDISETFHSDTNVHDSCFYEGLAMVSLDGKWGYIDKTGNEVINPQYDAAEPFSEGLAAVCLNGKWGYIDKIGKQVIPLKYAMVESFTEGMARVNLPDRASVCIDKTGNEVIPYKYLLFSRFSEGLAVMMNNNSKFGFIDKTCKEVLPCIYDRVGPFSEGLATVEVGKKSGFMDKTGNIVISPKYDWVECFKDGMALVRNRDRFGYIDKTGKEVVPCKYEWAENFYNGLACVTGTDVYLNNILLTSGKAFIDKTGKEVLYPQYDYVGDFSEGLAKVASNKKYGYMDKTGSEVISTQYTNVYDFKEGVAFVKQGKKLGIIKNPIVVSNQLVAGEIERLCGDNRYGTASAISKKGWVQSDNVILASGEDYHDALISSSFASLKDAPILITGKDKLDDSTSVEIARLKVKTVYIIGNTDSISQSVENTLKNKYNVIRIGGLSYSETNIKVAEEVKKIKQFDTVIIATQDNFPDALAASPFSAMNTMPIIFTSTASISSDTLDKLQKWGIKSAVIAGGTGVVSSNVENQIKATNITTTRLCGADRYDTALEIIKHFEPKSGYTNISIATGDNYPDALAGAALAAKLNTPVVLVNNYGVKDNIFQYLNGKTIDKAYLFGGNAVINDGIVNN